MPHYGDVSQKYVVEKPIAVPGRGFFALPAAVIAAVGAAGAWWYTALSWKYTCQGSDSTSAPAPVSPQAHRCDQISQSDAKIALATLAVVGSLIAASVVWRWMYGRAGAVVVVLAILLPVVLQFGAFFVASQPSDSCDALARSEQQTALQQWRSAGRTGDRPDMCTRA